MSFFEGNPLHYCSEGSVGDILPFKKATKKLGMCQYGHHQWVIDKKKKFDVREGKLITRYKCSRCGKEKVKGV